MTFKSKPEAYTFAIVTLIKINLIIKNSDNFDKEIFHTLIACREELKILVENHEQDKNVAILILEKAKNCLRKHKEAYSEIEQVQTSIAASDFKQTLIQKYENPLSRRFESELGIALLKQPTTEMMIAIGAISQSLLLILEEMEKKSTFRNYVNGFLESSHPIAFGAFKRRFMIEDLKLILSENDPGKLAEIMHIHLKFALNITREIPILNAPARYPTGELKNILKDNYPGDSRAFFSQGVAEKSNKWRSILTNEIFGKSDLYTKLRGRGRGGDFEEIKCSRMGLLLQNQVFHEKTLPMHISRWSPDSKCQPADLDSPYVLDLIENDAVYIAGPSSMCGMLLGQMEVLGNFDNEDMKKHYLNAVLAYIVPGGFHSPHEVLGPAQYILKLVPGYKVQPPAENITAPPPNYHQYFTQQAAIDPEFMSRRELAWASYLNYFNTCYAPRFIKGYNAETIDFFQEQYDFNKHLPAELKTQLIDILDQKINSQPKNKGFDLFINAFGNTNTKKSYINNINILKTAILCCDNYNDLEEIIIKFKDKEEKKPLKKTPSEKYNFYQIVKEIELIITSYNNPDMALNSVSYN